MGVLKTLGVKHIVVSVQDFDHFEIGSRSLTTIQKEVSELTSPPVSERTVSRRNTYNRTVLIVVEGKVNVLPGSNLLVERPVVPIPLTLRV